MANSNNNSDYNKPHLDLYTSLPEVLQNDASRSIFSNLFDRYLTKQEVKKVAGYIGEGNRNAIQPRKILEDTVHRQAFQLQPVLHDKIGSVDHSASWKDIQNELIRIGVDMDDYPEWGKTVQYNWVPPVDIDKVIHYQDYYWYDEDTPNSKPEYITIRSRCSTATANANFWQSLNDEFGSEIDIKEILPVDDMSIYPSANILGISSGANTITVDGDVTTDLLIGQFFDVVGTVGSNGIYQIVSAPIYDGVGQTVLPIVPGTILTSEGIGGQVNQRKFDKLLMAGEFIRLFDPGFVYFVRESSNVELNDAFGTVVDVEYDAVENETIISIDSTITDNQASGVVSLLEQLNFYLAERDCQCSGSIGWDLLLWDDNVDLPLWDNPPGSTLDPANHQTLLGLISNVGLPTGVPTGISLWYDTSSDIVYQYKDTAESTGWVVLWTKFSSLLEKTEGFALWDFTPGCGIVSVIKSAEQWIDTNFWLHKSDVPSFSIAKQAQFPIMEYDWDLELNDWSYTESRWKYRRDKFVDFVEVDFKPSLMELQPLDLWERRVVGSEERIVFDERYGDLTETISVGSKFQSAGVGVIFEVVSSVYKTDAIGQPLQTEITIAQDIVASGLNPGFLSDNRPSETPFHPFRTANDDAWKEYGDQWLYIGATDTVPVNHQPISPGLELSPSIIPRADPLGFEYVLSYRVKQFVITQLTPIDTFDLGDEFLAGTQRPLNRRALVGTDDIRVYINDIREYGSYDELVDNAVKIVGISGNTFVLSSDVSNDISTGDQIRVTNNTGFGGSGVYDVASVSASSVIVSGATPIPATATISGEVSNITTPITTVGEFSYVRGIKFFPGFVPSQFDIIRIEVGEASIQGIGLSILPVRTQPDNVLYLTEGNSYVSSIEYRLVEQVKAKVNQYPLFDIYNADGTTAFDANPIFGYLTSPDADVVPALGLRLVADFNQRIFSFDQFLTDQDDGEIFTYRDYSTVEYDFWFNNATNKLMFWTGFVWTDKVMMDTYYRDAVVSNTEPGIFEQSINGLYWYDTLALQLFRRNTGTATWDPIAGVIVRTTDNTLQSVWKKGLNDEEYIPTKVDWVNRSEAEYNDEKTLFVEERIKELLATVINITLIDAIIQSNDEWSVSQSNHLSLNGDWIGDWEIPGPLYYNHMHENRKIVTSRELLTHFVSIIEAQPKLPGYNGPAEGMFHLIATGDVNYGLGGTIHEYGDSFDMLLSSIFVNNVNPRTLIEFGHDQYEALLNNIKEIYRSNAIAFMTNVSEEAILDFSAYVTEEVISAHETQDYLGTLYGDSAVYNFDTAEGIRNWIITLPYMSVLRKRLPERLIDSINEINQVVHHDGHRNDYFLTPATRENVIRTAINAPDDRTRFPTPADDPLDTFGRLSTDLPPNTVTDFGNLFNTPILGREGVYWYTVIGTTRELYRLSVASAGPDEPSSSLVDGTLWIDTTIGFEVLRNKVTDSITGIVDWLPVPGLVVGDNRLHNGSDPLDVTTSTIAAWTPIDLDIALGDAIFNIETAIYENAPDPVLLRYELDKIRDLNSVKYDAYLLEAFNDFVSQSEISLPFVNFDYSPNDPFTWNYKYSTPGVGVGIVDADSVNNTFTVEGDFVSTFDPCTALSICPSVVSFFVKNSDGNDGVWNTIQSTVGNPSAVYDTINDLTIITILEPVTEGMTGVMYTGMLPKNSNDGSESGGDWRDYYQKLYGTPYPHLEPWKLQGYGDKPAWWDIHYRNNDEKQWGDRRWKYKHGFDIVGIDIVDDSFFIDGDFRSLYVDGQSFTLADTPSAIYDSSFTVSSLVGIYNVNTGTAGNAVLTVPGNLTATLTVGTRFATSDSFGVVTGLFTVEQITFTGPPGFDSLVTVAEEILDATGITNITGVTYDPVANQTRLRIVDDLTVNVFGGRLMLHHGMWEQIRIGRIPAGELYSNGITSVTGNPIQDTSIYGLRTPTIPTYNYFSVNIDNVDIGSGSFPYRPDDVLPPYFDHTLHYTTSIDPFDFVVRSVFSQFSTEVVSPGANYVFGDAGPIEWMWRESSQYLYDQMTVAYRLDPMHYVSKSFGIDTFDVTGLPVDMDTKQPISHNRITFHGEISDSELFTSNGTNQWYVNFNRFGGYDVNYADFNSLWTNWKAPLTYQFATFVDTPSLDIDHRYVDISDVDFDIASKRAPGVEDYWYDVFDVHVTSIPPSIRRYDNQLDWELEINTNLPQSRTIEHYDVRNYQFYANPVTGSMTLYTWEIVTVDAFNKTFAIQGDQTTLFITDAVFIVSDSTGNDDTYKVESSKYDMTTGTTLIELDVIIPSIVSDGTITLSSRVLPWQTGDVVYLSTAESLPAPLQESIGGGLIPYFIIVDDVINFRLASSPANAAAGIPIVLGTTGRRDHFVGEIRSTFISNNAAKTDTMWRHYELDKSNIKSFSTPHHIKGMQRLIDIIDGYDVLTYDRGWRINEDNKAADPDTGRPLGWQVEVERFIDYAFGLRSLTLQNVNKYKVSVDTGSNVWRFIEPETKWETGDAVNVFSSNNVLPSPIVQNVTYYIIRDTDDFFRLATSKRDAKNGNNIVVPSDAGVGDLQIGNVRVKDFSRHQEINPTRNSVWFRPTRGIVSNVLEGPSQDARTSNLIYDQNGEPIKASNLRVFREDKVTKMMVISDKNPDVLNNDINPYTFLHFGGMHLFIDAYEHVLRFNNYTSENVLLYDPFIGLNVTKYEMLFNRQVDFNERPNMGGYYMHTFFNQGADLRRNLEASVEDIRHMYNTHNVLESTQITTAGRKSLGYDGTREYLDNLNLHAKSQFLFWKGAIQTKGSLQSIAAFVNSRRFIDAKLDDFWAFRLADFGSSEEKEYPELFITTEDARSNDIRLQFVDDTDFCNPGYNTNVYDKEDCGYAFPNDGEPVLLADATFTPIRITDDDRWFNQPDQLSALRNNGLNLHFELKPTSKLNIHFSDVVSHSFVSATSTLVNGVSYMTYVVAGYADVSSNDYVAIRQSVVSLENTEYVVIGSSFDGINTTVIVDVDPFAATSGDLFVGPSVEKYNSWIVMARDVSLDRQFLVFNSSTSIWEHHGQWLGDIISGTELPILRHNCGSDASIVRLRLYSEGYTFELPVDPDIGLITERAPIISLPVDFYIPHTGGVKVFKLLSGNNFKQLTVNVDYVESLIPDGTGTGTTETLSNIILFRDAILPSDSIRVVYVTSELVDTVHYDSINSNIVQINDLGIFDKAAFPNLNNVSVWGLSVDEESQNPAKLIDKISETVISAVQVWDPARGNHYAQAIHNIDLQNDYDPARYNLTPQNQELIPGQVYSIDPWTERYVGTTWLDTTNLEYLPYYDTKVTPDLEARLRQWGQLADWGAVEAYEWVKSDVSPEVWEVQASAEEGDTTIAEGTRKSGTPRKTLFEDVAGDWKEIKPIKQDFDITIDALDLGGDTYQITASNFVVGDIVDVYVSGKLHLSQHELVTLDVVVEATIFDRIRVLKPIPTDRAFIDDEIEAGRMLEDFQMVVIDRRNDFGGLIADFYFWVSNKGTKPDGKNRSDNLRNSVRNLENIPAPYMFFQELKPKSDIEIEGNKLLSRIEQHTTAIGQTSVVTELPIAPESTVVVMVDSVAIPSVDVTFVDGEQVISFLAHPQAGGDLMEVMYTGLYDETVSLPARFVQMVSRGMRGIIDADRRYTLRYTRDFTLRDDISNGETPLEMKNLHSEWEMFRQEQPYHINRLLWDKITESMIQYKLTDSTVRVPSFERELYDDKFGTSTQYGISDGQAFVSGDLAMASILADLENPDNNFQPIDINVFFDRHNFDSPDAIVAAMDTIYNTYSFIHVNRIFFSVLQDAMSTQTKYADIIKTSMVSLHGIRPFQINGVFDD